MESSNCEGHSVDIFIFFPLLFLFGMSPIGSLFYFGQARGESVNDVLRSTLYALRSTLYSVRKRRTAADVLIDRDMLASFRVQEPK